MCMLANPWPTYNTTLIDSFRALLEFGIYGCHTVWLRTCYDPDLAERYEQMKWESEVPGEGSQGTRS